MDAWTALSKSRQRRIRSAITDAFAADVLREGADGAPAPHVHVETATRDGDDRVTVRFVADCRVETSPSLDDSRTTRVVARGTAVYVPDRGVTVTFEDVRYITPEEEAPPARTPPLTCVTIVRCPKCGSTDAGATEHFYEITEMTCASCGHRDLVDRYELGEEWNVNIVLPPGATELPAFVAPLAAQEEPAAAPPVPNDLPPAYTRDTGRPSPDLYYEPADSLSPHLRCPRCGSRAVRENRGRAERHFTFLECADCDHGEEISSLSAGSRWNPDGS